MADTAFLNVKLWAGFSWLHSRARSGIYCWYTALCSPHAASSSWPQTQAAVQGWSWMLLQTGSFKVLSKAGRWISSTQGCDETKPWRAEDEVKPWHGAARITLGKVKMRLKSCLGIDLGYLCFACSVNKFVMNRKTSFRSTTFINVCLSFLLVLLWESHSCIISTHHLQIRVL